MPADKQIVSQLASLPRLSARPRSTVTEHLRWDCLSWAEQKSIYRCHLFNEERRANDDLIDVPVVSAALYLCRIAFGCSREDGNALCTWQRAELTNFRVTDNRCPDIG